ncbi:dUTP diphosphatase [Paenibacillus glucanolyticus]|uniref:dUTP diphosphatase n=1 Tax=Paenibacillus glucanolyticus TaxID=59843 RepID=UPI00096F8944|nr:dUTP diphosphatase [Paenibacillus glucanolyticus]OMF70478.1 hypothetical protein BK142_23675 [Paenibacillus glucanolyticus]
MNLTKLFEMQRELDERIVKEKGLEGKDLLPQKILALQVELGECANEWRGFKFWSKDQKSRTLKIHSDRDAYLETNPLLEEYIDCLHFILSIGLEIGFEIEDARYLHKHNVQVYKDWDGITEQFSSTFSAISDLFQDLPRVEEENYEELFLYFLALGEMLDFTWEQIEAAYTAKNAVNHNRQSTGY